MLATLSKLGRDPFVMNRLHQHRLKLATLVRPKEQLLVRADRACSHQPRDNEADAIDIEDTINMEFYWCAGRQEEPTVSQARGDTLQECSEGRQALARHVGDLEDGTPGVRDQSLRCSCQVILTAHQDWLPPDCLGLDDVLQHCHVLLIHIRRRYVNLRHHKHEGYAQGQRYPQMLAGHSLEAGVGIDDDHRVVRTETNQAKDCCLEVLLVPT
mmetsp:Transcript_91527/g.267828  ORF Transcript_91527/g.267828 Transcript_91527/m.267828 type:complete len:213 (-) Transcript_91527:545-1183(-)